MVFARFVSVALTIEGVNQEWKHAIFLSLMTGLLMLAGADDMCGPPIRFGYLAAPFAAFTFA